MNLIEIRCPRGSLEPADRAAVAGDIAAGFVGDQVAEELPEQTLRRARAMTHVGFGELDGWTSGDGPWQPGATPPLWITITVPELWRDELSRHLIGWVRRAVRRLDARHEWERSIGDLWINIVGVGDGSIGLDGKPASADDVVALMTEEFRAQLAAGEVDLPADVVIDPMCGMKVKLRPGAITLDHAGTTLGFCARNCRDAYARRENLLVPDQKGRD